MARTLVCDGIALLILFIVKRSPHLDGAYAAFEKVTEGMNTVNKIAETDTDYSDRPLEDQVIKAVTVDTFV